MSFRNRCIIAGANGLINLSVPLEKGRDQKALVKDIRVSGRDNWQLQQWKTIESSYNRSPWFDYYRDSLILLYQKKIKYLADWNLNCFEWTLRQLQWTKTITQTSSYSDHPDPALYRDIRNLQLPSNYAVQDAPRYQQVFQDRYGFSPNLSVLDLLFCEGKMAAVLLSS